MILDIKRCCFSIVTCKRLWRFLIILIIVQNRIFLYLKRNCMISMYPKYLNCDTQSNIKSREWNNIEKMPTMRRYEHVLLQGRPQMYKKIFHFYMQFIIINVFNVIIIIVVKLSLLLFLWLNCFERILIIELHTLIPEEKKNWKKICRLYPVNTHIYHMIKYIIFLCFYAYRKIILSLDG